MAKAAAKELAQKIIRKSGNKEAAKAGRNIDDLVAPQFREDIKSLRDVLESPSAIRDPVGAAKLWDRDYQNLAKNIKFQGFSVGPAADKVTYRLADGKMISLRRDMKPPEGAERVSLTDVELRQLMPPRPIPPKAPETAPNAYNNPPPPGYGQTQAAPQPAPQPAPSASPETVALARETVAPRPTPSPWQKPTSVPSVKPMAPEAVSPSVASLAAPAAVIGAGGAAAYGFDPEGFTRHAGTSFLGRAFPTSPGDSSPNIPPTPYMGDTLSYGAEDMQPGNYPWNPVGSTVGPQDMEQPMSGVPAAIDRRVTPVMPDQSGRENPGMDLNLGQEQRFRPAFDPGQAQRFNPSGVPAAAREVLQRAQNTPQAQAQRAAAVMQQSPNELTVQKGPEQGPSALTRFIRGDWSEGADQRIMDAVRRQREESGVSEGMARGGAPDKPKKTNKDDVLHKALEIIHHMLTRR